MNISKNDLEKIFKVSGKHYKEEDICVFPLVLVDNNLQKNFDRITIHGLYNLSGLLVGKKGNITGKLAERASLETRNAKGEAYAEEKPVIFHAWYEDMAKSNFMDVTLYQLKAKAYLVKTPENADVVKALEVVGEIGASLLFSAKSYCSICGKQRHIGKPCEHIEGNTYDGSLSFNNIENIDDVYGFEFNLDNVFDNAVAKLFEKNKNFAYAVARFVDMKDWEGRINDELNQNPNVPDDFDATPSAVSAMADMAKKKFDEAEPYELYLLCAENAVREYFEKGLSRWEEQIKTALKNRFPNIEVASELVAMLANKAKEKFDETESENAVDETIAEFFREVE